MDACESQSFFQLPAMPWNRLESGPTGQGIFAPNQPQITLNIIPYNNTLLKYVYLNIKRLFLFPIHTLKTFQLIFGHFFSYTPYLLFISHCHSSIHSIKFAQAIKYVVVNSLCIVLTLEGETYSINQDSTTQANE